MCKCLFAILVLLKGLTMGFADIGQSTLAAESETVIVRHYTDTAAGGLNNESRNLRTQWSVFSDSPLLSFVNCYPPAEFSGNKNNSLSDADYGSGWGWVEGSVGAIGVVSLSADAAFNFIPGKAAASTALKTGAKEVAEAVGKALVRNADEIAQAAIRNADEVAQAAASRVRHYTSPEGLKGIQGDMAINPSRGGGVHVETGPFGPASTGARETGAAGRGAYVEFDAPNVMQPTKVGPRNTAVIPSEQPVPIQNLNPTFRTIPWWQF